MRKKFDIKYRPQIESGEYKVETRDGKPARIVCWDLKGNKDFFILALVEKNQREVSYCYPATGCCNAACDPEGKDDLFLVTPEEELTEFENGMLRYLQEAANRKDDSEIVESTKKYAEELLSLARDQFIKDGYVIEKKAFHDAAEKVAPEVIKEVSENVDTEEALRFGYEKGKAEASKNFLDSRRTRAMSKRAEEAALKAYPDYRSWDGGYVTQRKPRTYYIKGYERAERDLGWHSVKEMLPPIDEEVIVLTDNIHGKIVPGSQYICYGHIVDKNIAVDYDGWNIPGVTHWMHCPKFEEE